MNYICNPMNIEYKYQFINMDTDTVTINREAADPSLVMFKGKYFLFPSMSAGFFVSDNLVDWSYHPLSGLPIYDYAPDVCVIGEYMYFSASHAEKDGTFYRTTDPIQGEFEKIGLTPPFWDPHLFADDDGRVYLYWGCSNITPIYGVELDPEQMTPVGKPLELIFSAQTANGYERNGENHIPPKTPEQIEQSVERYLRNFPNASEEMVNRLRIMMGNDPYIEGPWMNKYNGKYYLQYASPGTQYNVYSDAVYVSEHPLGPYKLARNNPYSYMPGGFITGAGHGSTIQDRYGNWWHASTMRISVNHMFERRLGLWPAGFDEDGELFCNQRFGDWPMKVVDGAMDPWEPPPWMLLSYGKPTKASSYMDGYEPAKAVDENVQSWWRAASNDPGEYIEVDLLGVCDVHAVQINFADDGLQVPLPDGAELHPSGHMPRYIDQQEHVTRWKLEGSIDGESYFTIEDRSDAHTDLPHDLIVRAEGLKARYIRCTVYELPYKQQACISGLRVFGFGQGELPAPTSGVKLTLQGELDLHVSWDHDDAVGHVILWGYTPEKLYHSYMVLGSDEIMIGTLIKGEPLFVRVDAFNEVGITEGEVFHVK